MKKTVSLLTIPSVFFTTISMASIDLYNENKTRLYIEGAAEIQLVDYYSKEYSNEIRIDDADLAFGVEAGIDSCLSAIAYMDFEFEQDNKGSGKEDSQSKSIQVKNSELWVGFRCSQWGQFTVGRQKAITDYVGIGLDYELGLQGVDFVKTSGDEMIRYQWGNPGDEGFFFGVSHDLQEKKGSNVLSDVGIGYRQDWFDVRAYYNQSKIVGSHSRGGDKIDYSGFDKISVSNDYQGVATDIDIKGFNLETRFYIDAWTLALSYGEVKYDLNGAVSKDGSPLTGGLVKDVNGNYIKQKVDVSILSASAKYVMSPKVSFGAGANISNWNIGRDAIKENSNEFDQAVTNIYLNSTYKIHSNVKLYAEIGYLTTTEAKYTSDNKRDLDNSKDGVFYNDEFNEFAYVVGMEVKF